MEDWVKKKKEAGWREGGRGREGEGGREREGGREGGGRRRSWSTIIPCLVVDIASTLKNGGNVLIPCYPTVSFWWKSVVVIPSHHHHHHHTHTHYHPREFCMTSSSV